MRTLIVVIMLLAGTAAPVYGEGVSVITTNESVSSNEVLGGFKETVQHPIIAEYNIDRDVDRGRKTVAEIQKNPDAALVFAIGAPALEATLGKNGDLPVVYALVPNPAKIIRGDTENVAGVNMDVPVTEVAEIVKALRPSVMRLGTISFDADHQFAEAVQLARAHGIHLVPSIVASPRELSGVLRSLVGKIDALWLASNNRILAPEVIEYLLLWSYENEIPLVGLAETHTQKGALLSLAPGSNRQMGREAGELVNRILSGEKLAPSPRNLSQYVNLTVNTNAANKLGIEIPDKVLERARNLVHAPVYKEGDWWVFRVKRNNEQPREYRLTYRNGKFESDQKNYQPFLERPFRAVFLKTDSVRKELDFPFYPGKQWSFRYHGILWDDEMVTPVSAKTWISSTAEVIGPLRQWVETPAGIFEGVQLTRNDDWPMGETLSGGGESVVFYFYSPKAKSVVQLKAKVTTDYRGRNVDHYRVELIAYGNKVYDLVPAVAKARRGHTRASREKAGAPLAASNATAKINWSRVKAPVYEEGDWWIFQVKRKDKSSEQYGVTYANGEFESNYPDFLKVSENRESISWLPLISVNLEGPKNRWFDFPLVPGKEWSFDYGHTHARPFVHAASDWASSTRAWRLVETRVKGPVRDPVDTPAGKFAVTEIRRTVEVPGRAAQEDYEFTYFYSPTAKSAVKLIAKGRAYVGLGESAEYEYTMELVAYGNRHVPQLREPIAQARTKPKARGGPTGKIDWNKVDAPVYQEGDWWVFRASIGGVSEEHRVEYKNGRFESDDMTFLEGKTRRFLPWATVHLHDPQRQWLKFPIAEGSWNFSYEAASAISSYPTVFDAEAEFVGSEPVSVGTRAGQFIAFEISRIDRANGRKPWGTLTYFYSPETKSIVKLSGKHYRGTITGGFYARTYYELELIDYRVTNGIPSETVGRLSTNK